MTTIHKHLQQISFEMERSEALYWSRLYEEQTQLAPQKTSIGSGTAFALPEVDILAMNRVISWGWAEDKLEEQLQRVIDFYSSHQCPRFFVQLSPMIPQIDKVRQILEDFGLQPYNHWAKLWRPISGYTPSVRNFFECREIGPDQAEIYGQIIFDSFDWTDSRLASFLAASVGKPGYTHYLLYHEGQAVAAGALHAYQTFGSMAFAGTLPEYRGMGAQSLLIHRRIEDAHDMGVKYLIAETAVDSPEVPSKSFQNLQRFGFDLAYQRENWLFRLG